MTAQIQYETPDGIETIERDDFHTEKEGYLYAYDTENGRSKVCIPTERVVIVNG